MSEALHSQSPGAKEEEDDRDRGGGFWYWLGSVLLFLLGLISVLLIILALFPGFGHQWFPGSKRVLTQNWGSSVVYPIDGYDSAGKYAAFDVAVLPENLTWAHKSTSVLAIDGLTMIAETEVPERVFTPELREGLGRSKSLIAVGLASQEGRVEVETQRAEDRATSAAGWLTAIAAPGAPIWRLNLGQFKGGCEAAAGGESTAWQRPLIIVGVRSEDEGVKLDEALADAISGKSNLPSRDCYTSFDLTRHR